MGSSKLILVAMVVLVLGAGVVVGRLSTRLPATVPAEKQPSWLADQLNLNPEQRQQMDAIWAETKQKMAKSFERRRGLEKERDQAVVALLTPEQAAEYDEIQEEYRERRAAMDKERGELIREAEERSRALLDDSQKKRWETMTKAMRERHNRGPAGQWSATAPGEGR
ncbi:MAG TPA: hypothetical protein VIL86_06325 [Tepidisphaeraceae bacterium]|jgi:Spy/CpxP family protein refolding chaperone